MATQTKSPGSQIKDIITNDTRQTQQQLLGEYRQFLADYKTGVTSAAVLWMLLGENNHIAVDVIREMKESARYILGFLAKPKTAKEFRDFRGSNAQDYSLHLIQLINALEWADNPCSRSETAVYELRLGVCSKQQLDGMECDLEAFQKMAM